VKETKEGLRCSMCFAVMKSVSKTVFLALLCSVNKAILDTEVKKGATPP